MSDVAVAAAVETPVVVEPVVAPVAAPVAAPALMPVAPVVPPVVAPVVAPADDVVAVTYDPTGDPGLDVALSFVGALGIAIDHPAMALASNGDFTALEAHLATLGAKATGYQQMVALAKDSHTRATAAAATAEAATTAMVHGIAGGKEQWDGVLAWAKGEATPEEQAELNALFDIGPMGARAAANLLMGQYRAAKGTVQTPKEATAANAGGLPVTNTSGPLSPKDYNAAVRELRSKLGNRMDASPEYADLRSRLRR